MKQSVIKQYDIVKCVDNFQAYLTKGKLYCALEVDKIDSGYIKVVNDLGNMYWFCIGRFIKYEDNNDNSKKN